MTATVAVATDIASRIRSDAMTINQVLAHKTALMDLPTFFKAAGIPDSTGYQEFAKETPPIPVIKIGRRRYVQTLRALEFLGLIAEEVGAGPVYQTGSPAGDDEGGGYQPPPPVEHITARQP